MHISNRDGWTLFLSQDSYSVTDPKGIKVNNPVFLVNGSLATPEQVAEKINEKAANAFSFQAFRNEDKVAILVGEYGLSGGGKKGAITASIAGLVAGVALSFKNRKAGAVLIATSFNAALYAIRTPEEKYSDKECVAKAAIAGTTNLATSALSSAIKGPIEEAISNPLAAQIVSQAVIGIAQEGASQAIKGEIDLSKMAVSAISSSASVYAGETVNGMLEAKEVSKIVIKAGLSGTAGATAATLTEDLLTGKSFSNIPAAALSGAALASINAIPGAYEIRDAIKAAEKIKQDNQEPPVPPKPPKAPPTPPKKPDNSNLNLEARKKEIDKTEEAVSAQEKTYTTAYNSALRRIAAYFNAGYHDREGSRKPPTDTVNRLLEGKGIELKRHKDTHYEKQSPIHNPAQDRKNLENAKADLARDKVIAENANKAYDASLKSYEADLKAYQAEKDLIVIVCPVPPPPAPAIPKLERLPVRVVEPEERQFFVRQLITQPAFSRLTQIELSYQVEVEERIERAKQAKIISRLPVDAQIASVSTEEIIESKRGEIKVSMPISEALVKISRLRELTKSSHNIEKIKRIKKHIAYLENKKACANETARDKKQKLTQQIDAYNKELAKL